MFCVPHGLNNPVKYSDPSGHIPCYGDSVPQQCSWTGTGHHQVNQVSRRRDLDTYTQFLLAESQNPAAGLTDVEMIARMMNFAAGFGTSTKDWANDITSVVNRTTGPFTLLTHDFDSSPMFGDTGFNLVYRDRENQVFHWWAYVNTAVQGGGVWAGTFGRVGNYYHEFWDITTLNRQPTTGASWQDYALSENGMALGLALNRGDIGPESAADQARLMLSTDMQSPIVTYLSGRFGNDLIPINILRRNVDSLQTGGQ